MNVYFCDKCGKPIKGEKWILIYKKYQLNNNPYTANYQESETKKEICETCKTIIDEIFAQRMGGILKLAEDLKTIYRLPTKTPKRKRKKKNGK